MGGWVYEEDRVTGFVFASTYLSGKLIAVHRHAFECIGRRSPQHAVPGHDRRGQERDTAGTLHTPSESVVRPWLALTPGMMW